VKLTQTPKPLATPAPDPDPEPSQEQKFEDDVKLMRQKLFGHEDDPVAFYREQKEKGEL
jgi:hypothetical protein